MARATPTGIERFFAPTDFMVSKTDLRGRLTYVNAVFCDTAGYTEEELLGRPHSIIRHPDMPMAVFDLLWSRIQGGEEVFAYVVNLCRNGDHYWVFAHVTPTWAPDGSVVGYHSNRRLPHREGVETVQPLYARLRAIELAHSSKREGLAASRQALNDTLNDLGSTYDAFVWSIARGLAA